MEMLEVLEARMVWMGVSCWCGGERSVGGGEGGGGERVGTWWGVILHQRSIC